jgi:predicted ATPase
MIYLKDFWFPKDESGYFRGPMCNYYTSYYPFQFFPGKGLSEVEFSDVTIFCGSNGSGKSTTLNVIGEKLGLKRSSKFNTTELFSDYVEMTDMEMTFLEKEESRDLYAVSRMITSDDVFNHILDIRDRNDEKDFRRDVIRDQRREYMRKPESRPREIDFDRPETVEKYRDYADMMNKTYSWYIRSRGVINERTYSNGENGFRYFTEAIQPGGIYLLDEPENSLSAQFQIDLADFLAGMARFYNCQFIISSHSPFILSIPFAKIYDMDSKPVRVVRWTELPSVRIYRDFFERHAGEFSG